MKDASEKFHIEFVKLVENKPNITRQDFLQRVPMIGEEVLTNTDGSQENFNGKVTKIRTVVVDMFCYHVVTLSVENVS